MNFSISQRTIRNLEGRTEELEEKNEVQDTRIGELERALKENSDKMRELE